MAQSIEANVKKIWKQATNLAAALENQHACLAWALTETVAQDDLAAIEAIYGAAMENAVLPEHKEKMRGYIMASLTNIKISKLPTDDAALGGVTDSVIELLDDAVPVCLSETAVLSSPFHRFATPKKASVKQPKNNTRTAKSLLSSINAQIKDPSASSHSMAVLTAQAELTAAFVAAMEAIDTAQIVKSDGEVPIAPAKVVKLVA